MTVDLFQSQPAKEEQRPWECHWEGRRMRGTSLPGERSRKGKRATEFLNVLVEQREQQQAAFAKLHASSAFQ